MRATYTGSFAKNYSSIYDAVGNRLTQDANGTLTNYSYDNANRLTSVNGQAVRSCKVPSYKVLGLASRLTT